MSRNFGIKSAAAGRQPNPSARGERATTSRQWALLALSLAILALVATLAVAFATAAFSQDTTPANKSARNAGQPMQEDATRRGRADDESVKAAACEAARDATAVAAAVSREYAKATDDTSLALRVMALTAQVEWEKRRDERCGTGAK